jgi:hypothetical protein
MTNRALLAAAALLWTLPAWGADQFLPGKSLLLRSPASGRQRAVFVAKSASLVAPTPSGPDDPRTTGATLEFRSLLDDESATLSLPAAGWTANPTGTVYHFHGTDVVKVALVKTGATLRVVAKSTGITLDEATQGSIGVILTSGTTRYCALFGGTIVHDEPGKFIAKNAPAPLVCPTSTVTTTSSTTSTTTTSTTTTTINLCGNGIINAGEQCDGAGSTCGAFVSCSTDCTCPCDPLDPAECLYPFPNDRFTIDDPSTDTGKRVHFAVASMPKNISNVPIVPDDYNLNDGFSPGASILTRVPNVDLAMTGAAPVTDVAASLAPGAPIVLVNAATGMPHPMWAEIDSNATAEAGRSVIIRPAINLDEGGRYIVVMRNMKDSGGAIIPAGPEFTAYRDSIPTGDPGKEARRAHMEDIFTTLSGAGIGRGDLYLAWDFTVASERNLSERLLFARDDAFTRLGASAPVFNVTTVDDNFDPGRIYRRVRGTYNVERYVNSTAPGARMVFGPDGMPIHQATPQVANFDCIIPEAALASAGAHAVPARPSLYGHGLLGTASEVTAGNVRDMANEHNFVFCATDWIGMSQADTGNAAVILTNLGLFPSLTDRLQQSMVDQLFLARLMIHPNGFASHPAFRDSFGASVIDPADVFYDGNSQGGIFGGTVMAIAQDIKRGVLGVPAMNYSLLLTRSTDFATYAAILYPSYPNELEHPLLLALIQMLWDRSDPNGYAHHMTTDPLPNTPQHKVLMHIAFGDHQVTTVAAEVEARTIGASIHQPAIAPLRNPDVTPYYLIPAIPSDPFDGSAMIVWDSGAVTPPITNTAPTTGPDPHSDPRNSPVARTQKSDFLRGGGLGTVVDVCLGLPCTAP